MAGAFLSENSSKMHSRSVIMGIFFANPDAPSRCTATDCLVIKQISLVVSNGVYLACFLYKVQMHRQIWSIEESKSGVHLILHRSSS